MLKAQPSKHVHHAGVAQQQRWRLQRRIAGATWAGSSALAGATAASKGAVIGVVGLSNASNRAMRALTWAIQSFSRLVQAQVIGSAHVPPRFNALAHAWIVVMAVLGQQWLVPGKAFGGRERATAVDGGQCVQLRQRYFFNHVRPLGAAAQCCA